MSAILTHSTGIGNGYGNQTLLDNPSLSGNALFLSIFAILLIVQVFLGVKHKTWGYMVAIFIGLLLEIIGYGGRIMLHNQPFNNDAFLVYLVTLTIGPALLSAAIYLCLARIVLAYGESLSRFKPRTYTVFFCTCDLICLILQAVGGGIASEADTQKDQDLGRDIMMGGLVFQAISLICFAIAAIEFGLRVRKARGTWNERYLSVVNTRLFKAFLVGLAVATVTIFIRSVYRIVELSGGFNGHLFTNDEPAFMVLEGAMIIIACVCLTVMHPAIAFQGTWHEHDFKFRTARSAEKFLPAKIGDEENQQRVQLSSVTAPK